MSATPVDDEKPLDDQGNDKDMAMITTKGPKKELTLGDEVNFFDQLQLFDNIFVVASCS